MNKVDVIVIGAGAAGLTVAYTAKGFGKEVLMIHEGKPGGECTWSGCIPSKAFIHQSNEIFTAKKYATFKADTREVMARVGQVIDHVYQGESRDVLEKDGFKMIQGLAKFTGPKEVTVKGQRYQAKRVFICTGSKPMVPAIEGLDQVPYLTNESFFKQVDLSASYLVLGGGAIGVEMAQAMTRLGLSVTLIEMADHILPREDEELTSPLAHRLQEEGVEIYTSHKAVKVCQEEGQVALHIKGPEESLVVKGDRLLLALGRQARIQELDLGKAGIKATKKGVQVDSHLETAQKGVYAVGDCTGPYLFSHMANAQGLKAVQNAFLPLQRKMDYSHVVWCTYTSPELARAGLSEKEARAKYGDSIRIYRRSYDELDRAKTRPGSLGQVKLILDRRGKILGASILGERAGELISEVQVLKTLGKNYGKLAGVIHPYPTYSEILNKISKSVLVDNLLNNPVIKLFRK